MIPFAQAKILTVIEKKEASRLREKEGKPMVFGVIAAINQGPERLLAKGTLRKDLCFYNKGRVAQKSNCSRMRPYLKTAEYHIVKKPRS